MYAGEVVEQRRRCATSSTAPAPSLHARAARPAIRRASRPSARASCRPSPATCPTSRTRRPAASSPPRCPTRFDAAAAPKRRDPAVDGRSPATSRALPPAAPHVSGRRRAAPLLGSGACACRFCTIEGLAFARSAAAGVAEPVHRRRARASRCALAAGATLGARRRERLGQDHARPRHPRASCPAQAGSDPLRRPRARSAMSDAPLRRATAATSR